MVFAGAGRPLAGSKTWSVLLKHSTRQHLGSAITYFRETHHDLLAGGSLITFFSRLTSEQVAVHDEDFPA